MSLHNESQKIDRDNALNTFMAKPEIFADLFNAYIYDGRQVICSENLEPADRLLSEVIGNDKGQYKLTRYRDVFKVYRDKQASYILLGIENQTAIHYAMPLRNMIYDALSLLANQRQISARHIAFKDLMQPDEYLSRFAKTDRLRPVITLVVYYGNKPWDGPFTLHDMISFPDDELRRFMPDHFINLVIPAKMWELKHSKLKTELREVFGCIRFSDNEEAFEAYIVNQPQCREMSFEAVQAVNACTRANIQLSQTGDKVNMCQAIIDMKQHAYERGYKEGEESGFQKGEERGFQKGEESGYRKGCQAVSNMNQHAYESGYQKGEESGFQKGEESGFQKGEESGFQKGEESLMAKIAHRMLSAKYDKQEISKMTGLSIQEIDKIVLV